MNYDKRYMRVLFLWVVVLSLVGPCLAQAGQAKPSVPSAAPPSNPNEDAWEVQQRKQLQKQQNLQRQQELKKDTEKLLELATELKQSVDKSSENTLSLDVIRKAEQIEKLAKSIKDKMKGP